MLEVTNVEIKLADGDGPLQAYATVTFNKCFVVHDVKVVEKGKGPFVSMPSSRYRTPCPSCGRNVPLCDRCCGNCGAAQPEGRLVCVSCRGAGGNCLDCNGNGKRRFHFDVCHPITSACRRLVEDAVLKAWRAELAKTQDGGGLTDGSTLGSSGR